MHHFQYITNLIHWIVTFFQYLYERGGNCSKIVLIGIGIPASILVVVLIVDWFIVEQSRDDFSRFFSNFFQQSILIAVILSAWDFLHSHYKYKHINSVYLDSNIIGWNILVANFKNNADGNNNKIYFKNRTPTEAVMSIKELFADNLHLCRQFEIAAGNKVINDPYKSFNVIMHEENDKREILRRIRNSVSAQLSASFWPEQVWHKRILTQVNMDRQEEDICLMLITCEKDDTITVNTIRTWLMFKSQLKILLDYSEEQLMEMEKDQGENCQVRIKNLRHWASLVFEHSDIPMYKYGCAEVYLPLKNQLDSSFTRLDSVISV